MKPSRLVTIRNALGLRTSIASTMSMTFKRNYVVRSRTGVIIIRCLFNRGSKVLVSFISPSTCTTVSPLRSLVPSIKQQLSGVIRLKVSQRHKPRSVSPCVDISFEWFRVSAWLVAPWRPSDQLSHNFFQSTQRYPSLHRRLKPSDKLERACDAWCVSLSCWRDERRLIDGGMFISGCDVISALPDYVHERIYIATVPGVNLTAWVDRSLDGLATVAMPMMLR